MAGVPLRLKAFFDQPADARRLGPFLLVHQLGRGGFAPVWLAKEIYGATELRTAAVKVFALDDASAQSSELPATRRIVDEARALCQVEHPNVVRFYALPIDEARGVMGLAMEHVAGTALDQRLLGSGRLTISETLAVGIAVASALAAVHGAGLVHRDVKPSNVVESAGVFKLIDFGIAAADGIARHPDRGADQSQGELFLDDIPLDSLGSKMSSVEASFAKGANEATVQLAIRCGTVGYIDPVCVSRGSEATPASDLYGLGATLFECLSGRLPAACGAPSGTGLRGEVLDGRVSPPSVRTLVPDVPVELARLVDSLVDPARLRRPTSAEWVAITLEQIRTKLAGEKRALPPENVGPFRGLARFEEGDRDVYFGRTGEVATALEMVRGRGLVALIGPSGSGKSSLARAGVLPAITHGALGGWPKRWDSVIVSALVDPRTAITTALEPFVPHAAEMEPGALVVALAERVQSTGWGLVLLVDQLEELATVADPAGRAWTAELLSRIGEHAVPGLRAIVALRRDLLDALLTMTGLGRVVIRSSVLIEPLRELVWRDVLDQALSAYGYEFEDDALREEVVGQLEGTAGAMPLVQFALTELWHNRDVGRKRITRAGFQALGGIAGALERHAEATLANLLKWNPGVEEVARRFLLALTTAQGTRATRDMDELQVLVGELAHVVLDTFESARLVVRNEEGVTLGHEALLTQWGRLRTWVSEAREDRLLVEELERDAAAWRSDPDGVPLWQRRRLSFGEDLRRRSALSETANEFLRVSRRTERRGRLFLAGSVGIAVVSLAVAGFAYVSSERAKLVEQQERTREVQEKQALIEGKQRQIDELLENAKDSEAKEKALALRTDIREVSAALDLPLPPVATSSAPEPSIAHRTSGPLPPTMPPPIVTPSGSAPAQPAAAATPTAAPTLKVRRKW